MFGAKPFLLQIERRRQHENVRVVRLFQERDREFRHHERAARIDLMHEIETLHVGRLRVGQRDRAGIVDHDIDAAELKRRLIQRTAHRRLVAHIDDERQRLPASLLDLGGGGEDRAGKFWMGLGRLRGNGDVRAVARGLEANREPDAA